MNNNFTVRDMVVYCYITPCPFLTKMTYHGKYALWKINTPRVYQCVTISKIQLQETLEANTSRIPDPMPKWRSNGQTCQAEALVCTCKLPSAMPAVSLRQYHV